MASSELVNGALDELLNAQAMTMDLDGTTDVDMPDGGTHRDKDDELDYSDPNDPGPVLPLTPLNTGDEESLDYGFPKDIAGGDDEEPGELTSEQNEDGANSKTVHGGDEMSQEQRELQELGDEVRALRVDRDVAVKMEKRVCAELRALREDHEEIIAALSRAHGEAEWERGRSQGLERTIEDLRYRIQKLDEELAYYTDNRHRKRSRSEVYEQSDRGIPLPRTTTPASSTSVSTRSSTPAMPSSPTLYKQATGRNNSTPEGENNGLITTTAQDVFMAPIETDKPKPGPNGPLYEEHVQAKHNAFADDAKHRVPLAPGRRTTLITLEPPRDIEYNMDKRGFPVDITGWNTIFQLQKKKPFYVFGLRCFYLWVYSSELEESKRTPVQQLAVDEYELPDWLATILGVIGTRGDENMDAKRTFPHLKRDAIGYDPALLAQLIQYREASARGCRFVDDAYSLDA
jgi:hypothetical protein